MENRYLRSGHYAGERLLVGTALVCLAISIVLPRIAGCVYDRKYVEAASYAVERVGDRRPPLTEEETREWWQKSFGVDISDKDARPEVYQLKDYTKKCKEEAASRPAER
jgi:hypothetical protein